MCFEHVLLVLKIRVAQICMEKMVGRKETVTLGQNGPPYWGYLKKKFEIKKSPIGNLFAIGAIA